MMQSLINPCKLYSYDIYTAHKHTRWGGKGASSRLTEECDAVGIITNGLAPADMSTVWKLKREGHFPLSLLRKGVHFKCRDGQASQPADLENILAHIGDKYQRLDQTVHSVVAAAGLRRALEEGGDVQNEFLEAICDGHLVDLHLDLSSSPAGV